MNGKIITSTREINRRPWLAALMSLAVPGLGQLYNGAAARALAFTLLRALPLWVFPFYAMLAAPSSITAGFIAAHIAVLAVTAASALDAALFAKRNRSIIPARYNGLAAYILYALTAAALYAASSAALYAYFVPAIAGDSSRSPVAAKGDLLVTNRLASKNYSPGDSVSLADGSVWRIIATGTDRVVVYNGIFVINGEPLKRSVPDDADSSGLYFASPENIYIEENRGVRYAVEQDMDAPVNKGMIKIAITKEQLLLARDLRIEKGWHRVIRRDDIQGRVEVLLPFSAIPEIILPSFGNAQ
ncbi:MAG TPA: hypothetical protein PK573_10875 [Spirochaetota bacterium]|nr:hypothetical protein [Spirochaetota bacterium]HRZ29087.1 hypothetical protein [Spirochaetota bacterium]HSA15879.1 hypothetical protein [Spirochaetota bacterium]